MAAIRLFLCILDTLSLEISARLRHGSTAVWSHYSPWKGYWNSFKERDCVTMAADMLLTVGIGL